MNRPLKSLIFLFVGGEDDDELTLEHEAELEQALQGVVMEVEAREQKPVSTLAVRISACQSLFSTL